MDESMGDAERQAIYEAVKVALKWWCRMYGKGSSMYESDICDIPEEMYNNFSDQERYCLDMVLEDVMRSLGKISFDEVSRIIDLSECEYNPVEDDGYVVGSDFLDGCEIDDQPPK